MRRRTVGLVMGVLIATVAGLALLVRLVHPVYVGAAERPSGTTSDPRLVRREFLTTDSVTVVGYQVPQESRGTLLVVWGLGDPQLSLTRDVGALSDRLGFHVMGLGLRGSTHAPVAPVALRDRFAYFRDIAAVIAELKRSEPSGPVILVGVRAGGGVVTRYLEQVAAHDAPPSDGVVLVDPLTNIDDLLRTPAAWQEPMEIWPRRAHLRQALEFLPLPNLERLRVARPAGRMTPVPGSEVAAGALLALVRTNPWPVWRSTTVPTLLLTTTRPSADQYPVNDTHAWEAMPPGQLLGSAMAPAFDAYLAPFREAATYRRAIPGVREVPILPP